MAEQVPPPAAPPPADMSGRPAAVSDTSKLIAALSYFAWTGIIAAIIGLVLEPYKNEKFVKFHAIQGLAVNIVAYVIITVTSFILIGFLVWIAWFVYSIVLALKAYKGEYFEVPGVYGFVKNYVGE